MALIRERMGAQVQAEWSSASRAPWLTHDPSAAVALRPQRLPARSAEVLRQHAMRRSFCTLLSPVHAERLPARFAPKLWKTHISHHST